MHDLSGGISSADQPPDEKLAAAQQHSGKTSNKSGHAPAVSRRVEAARKVHDAARDLYKRVVLELILRQKPLKASKDGRRIPLQPGQAPLHDERRGGPYISNTIRTSRYTVWDFVPKQLFFQFTRLANFYFLCIGIPQMIPGLSTTGNYTTIVPLLLFVTLTIAKEGYDDYRRARLDKVENARLATILRSPQELAARPAIQSRQWRLPFLPKKKVEEVPLHQEESTCGLQWAHVPWRDIRVGDVIRLTRDEDVPSDIILLHADGENDMAYIETMALDGETNLKSKQVSSALKDCTTIDSLHACRAEFVLEDPNPDLYRFDGKVTCDGKTLPLTLTEVIYRGSTLRNTPCAVGIVINTGEECKIRLNANRHPRAKKPHLERVMNRIVITLALYVILLTLGCSLGYLFWQKSTEDKLWFLMGDSVAAQEIIIGYAIQFNNIIPLALYISLEIVRLGQMYLLSSDIGMYDEVSDTPAKCNTNTILEDLGQIGYVFSDKTGTLTENVMKFRKLSIAGTSWLHEKDMQIEDSVVPAVGENAPGVRSALSPNSPTTPGERRSIAIPEDLELPTDMPMSPTSVQTGRRSSSHWRSAARPDHVQPDLTTDDLLEFIRLRPHSPFAKKALEYILAMALCHTCLPEIKDGKIDFQASSPDELALVKAAQELGFLVIQRSAHSTTLRVTVGPAADEVYEILDVIEFSSKRKRMSIIVRRPDGRLWLICKGADSMILPRLKMAHLAIQKATEVRKSADMEREMLRRSEHRESRSSFGGRASLTLRRSLALDSIPPSKRPALTTRSQSFETSKLRASGDLRRPALITRGLSFDVSPSRQPNTPTGAQALPDKFSFLNDASLLDEGAIYTQCFKHLDDFASEGLRTLLFAQRFLPETEYQAWRKLYHDATISLTDRDERIEAVGEMIEQDLDLVGASAIEDKLQKGVPQAIDKLRRANIKIWMLTGDKRETAINIAHSARICKPHSDIFILDATKGDLEAQLLGVVEELQLQLETGSLSPGGPGSHHTVVCVDGHTLGAIEASPSDALRTLFYELIPTIDSVICCRASPAQKALLVRTIRQTPRLAARGGNPGLTLAIGDGANDLAMIAEAHVGIGISGKEGLQAARVADFSVSQFRFLSRLLLVHGRWNYARTAKFVLATFWKEMFFYTGTVAYQRYNGYTGTSLYESWSLTVLNTLFTSLCNIVPGMFEKELGAETLLAVPELYAYGQRGRALDTWRYAGWMLGAVAEGVVVWFACWAGLGVFGQTGGGDGGLFALGDLVFSINIMWTNYKLLIIETYSKTVIVLVAFFITTSGWWAWNGFLSGIYPPGVSPYAVRNGFAETFGADPVWWLTALAVLGVLTIAETSFKVLRRNIVATGGGSWKALRRALVCCCGRWGGGARGRSRRRSGVAAAGAAGAEEEESAADLDLGMWQEMEQDPMVRERLRQILRAEEEEEEEGAEGPVGCEEAEEDGAVVVVGDEEGGRVSVRAV